MVPVGMGNRQPGDHGGGDADIGQLARQGGEFQDALAPHHVFIDGSADMAVRQAGVEQQNPLGVHHQETGIGEVGVAGFILRQAEILRQVGDDGAAVEHVKPDPGRMRQGGQSRLGGGGQDQPGQQDQCQANAVKHDAPVVLSTMRRRNGAGWQGVRDKRRTGPAGRRGIVGAWWPGKPTATGTG